MMPPGTLVNWSVSLHFLSLATPDEMPKADKATIKITERRKSLGFMIQVRLIREYRRNFGLRYLKAFVERKIELPRRFRLPRRASASRRPPRAHYSSRVPVCQADAP